MSEILIGESGAGVAIGSDYFPKNVLRFKVVYDEVAIFMGEREIIPSTHYENYSINGTAPKMLDELVDWLVFNAWS